MHRYNQIHQCHKQLIIICILKDNQVLSALLYNHPYSNEAVTAGEIVCVTEATCINTVAGLCKNKFLKCIHFNRYGWWRM